jgi:hypothetical protein
MASPEVHPPTSSEPDWTDQVTDLVVDLVDTVRDKTTGPVLKGARGVVYGTVAFFAVIVLGIVALAFGGRAISLLPIDEWISYTALGILFCLAGFYAWSKRYAS